MKSQADSFDKNVKYLGVSKPDFPNNGVNLKAGHRAEQISLKAFKLLLVQKIVMVFNNAKRKFYFVAGLRGTTSNFSKLF